MILKNQNPLSLHSQANHKTLAHDDLTPLNLHRYNQNSRYRPFPVQN